MLKESTRLSGFFIWPGTLSQEVYPNPGTTEGCTLIRVQLTGDWPESLLYQVSLTVLYFEYKHMCVL